MIVEHDAPAAVRGGRAADRPRRQCQTGQNPPTKAQCGAVPPARSRPFVDDDSAVVVNPEIAGPPPRCRARRVPTPQGAPRGQRPSHHHARPRRRCLIPGARGTTEPPRTPADVVGLTSKACQLVSWSPRADSRTRAGQGRPPLMRLTPASQHLTDAMRRQLPLAIMPSTVSRCATLR